MKKKKPIQKKKSANPKFKLDREALREKSKRELNTTTARFSTLEKERSRLYSERSWLKKKLKQAKTKIDIQAIRSRMRKTTFVLNDIKRRYKTYRPLKGFGGGEKQTEVLSQTSILKHIYKWEARDEVDKILDSGEVKVFIINGVRYTRRQAGIILSAVDDLETECDLSGTYYMDFEFDLQTKTLTVSAGR